MSLLKTVLRCAPVLAAFFASLAFSMSAEAQWAPAALLSQPGDYADPSMPVVVAEPSGGFHAVYMGNARKDVRYRRFDGTTLSAPITLQGGNYVKFNPSIALSTNGDLHVAYENWATVGPEVGYNKSTNKGATFSSTVDISNSGDSAKWPLISSVGTNVNDDALVTYYSSPSAPGGGNNRLRSITYNGSSWGPDTQMAQSASSEFKVAGIAKNPVDGKVYRLFDSGGGNSLSYAVYDPASNSWGGTQVAAAGIGFFARAKIAINDSGTIAIAYDLGDRSYVTMKKPTDASFSAPQQMFSTKWWGDLLSIPGTDDFYMLNSISNKGIYGRAYSDGVWSAVQTIDSTAQDNVWMRGSSAGGKIYAVWQYGNSGNVLSYYSQMTYYAVPEPGTIALAGAGLVGLVVFARRRRAKAR